MYSSWDLLYLWIHDIRQKANDFIERDYQERKLEFLPPLPLTSQGFLSTSPQKKDITTPCGFFSYDGESSWNRYLEVNLGISLYLPYEGSILGEVLSQGFLGFLSQNPIITINRGEKTQCHDIATFFQLKKITIKDNKDHREKIFIVNTRGFLDKSYKKKEKL